MKRTSHPDYSAVALTATDLKALLKDYVREQKVATIPPVTSIGKCYGLSTDFQTNGESIREIASVLGITSSKAS
ncbi:MAG: hypothetical protein IKX20_11475 [Paludibacteraceae bacterium]|nr:hypothetical protein [Paludibacteraceae bacterium]